MRWYCFSFCFLLISAFDIDLLSNGTLYEDNNNSTLYYSSLSLNETNTLIREHIFYFLSLQRNIKTDNTLIRIFTSNSSYMKDNNFDIQPCIDNYSSTTNYLICVEWENLSEQEQSFLERERELYNIEGMQIEPSDSCLYISTTLVIKEEKRSELIKQYNTISKHGSISKIRKDFHDDCIVFLPLEVKANFILYFNHLIIIHVVQIVLFHR